MWNTYNKGKLVLGWEVAVRGKQASTLLSKYPYATEGSDLSVRIPFPTLRNEWNFFLSLCSSCELDVPAHVQQMGERALQNAKKRFELSKIHVPNGDLAEFGLKTPPFPFQKVALDYIESLGYRALVGDDMGLGKTMTGIAAAVRAKSQRVVVVTRSVALDGWQRRALEWTFYEVRQAMGKKPVARRKRDNTLKAPDHACVLNEPIKMRQGIVILNFDILEQWKDHILEWKPDFLVIDEAHIIKEPKAKRSMAAFELIRNIDNVVLMTGTPIANRPIELYYLLDALHPGKWGTFFQYAKRYCDAKQKVIKFDYVTTGKMVKNQYGKMVPEKIKKPVMAWDFSGASNLQELHTRLRASCMIRRMKDDVLDNLLPPINETIPIEASGTYLEMEQGLLQVIDGILEPASRAAGEAALHELFAAAAEEKIVWGKEWIKAFLEDSDKKLVVFFNHNRVGVAMKEFLEEMGIKTVHFWGTESTPNGEYIFQNEDDYRVALCSFGVAREALTLTASSYQLFLEFTWVPGWMDQAKDRVRRIGQKDIVNYYYAVLKNSAEERIVHALLQKQDIISVIMQGKKLKSIDINTKLLGSG